MEAIFGVTMESLADIWKLVDEYDLKNSFSISLPPERRTKARDEKPLSPALCDTLVNLNN
jgi:hypothetical protein